MTQFDSKTDFEKHIVSNHLNSDLEVKDCKTYGGILLIPGPGHCEINYIKVIFKSLWTIILIDLAKLLGYRSVKALASCESVSSHHKSWQFFFLNIFARYQQRNTHLLC